ncbi:hypothetical protein [Streptomyces sp. NPDC051546]|uniref:hypothetical protein n=1 Tax=Streptomyces sp. NPDC051546 TaxID=3365655 RepID=UPI0037BCC413
MSRLLLALVTALQVMSALVALVAAFRPSLSERTRHRAVHALTATTLLSAIAHLVTGHLFYGTLLTAVTVLLLITWVLGPLVRWARGRKSEKFTK